MPDLVTEIGKLFAPAIPVRLAAVDRVGSDVPVLSETHVVEDEKFRFRTEERGVGDPGALQVRLGFFGDAARVAIVRLARDRLDDRADEAERRLGVEDIDPGASPDPESRACRKR